MAQPTYNYTIPRDGRFIDRTKIYLVSDELYIFPHIREWMKENLSEPWFYCGLTNRLFFVSATDGALFKLTWL